MSAYESFEIAAARAEERRGDEADAIDALAIAAHERLSREFRDTLRAGPRTPLDIPAWQGKFGPHPARTEPIGDYLCSDTTGDRFDELLSILAEVAAGHPVAPERAQAWIDAGAKEFADTFADDVAQAEFDAGRDDDFDEPDTEGGSHG